MEFQTDLQAPDQTAILNGFPDGARIRISTIQLVGVSMAELRKEKFSRYFGVFERFVRAVILGFRGTVAADFVSLGGSVWCGISVGCIFGTDSDASWSPHLQLERLRLQASRAVRFDPIDPAAHLQRLGTFTRAIAIDPAAEEVAHGGLTASAVLPIEVSPSGVGTLAQVLETFPNECAVRFIVAPVLAHRPDTVLLMDQLANAERLCVDPEVPRAVAYRAKGIRLALQRMVNTWLGQACAMQVQVLSDSSGAAGIVQLLREEIARPKFNEIQELKGQTSMFINSEQSEAPMLTAYPREVALPMDTVSVAPIPSFWVDGTGARPKQITAIGTASLVVVPPLPDFCDLSSVSSVVVEARGASQPKRWSSDGCNPVGKDSLGNYICFDDEALSRHVHLIGVPGSGKTTLMNRMAIADLVAKRGFLILDPHGDLAKRVALAADWPPGGITGNVEFEGLRILRGSDEGEEAIERDVGAIIEAIESALPVEFTGPRFRQLARACLTLHAFVGVGSPVANAVDYVQDDERYESAMARYTGPDWVRASFKTYREQSGTEQAQVTDWFVSKFTDYLRTSGAKRLFAPVGQGSTARDLVESGSQMVIDFAALGTSTYDAGLLGQLFVTSFLRDLISAGPSVHRRFLLYLDEVQLFFGPAVERALQEGRKYGLSVIAGHQTSSQLSTQRFDSLVGQVGLELVFRSSLRDSQLLAERLELSFESISALSDFSCWVAGGVAVQRGGSFLMETWW